MLTIGCDYHPGFQQIACIDSDTGELGEACEWAWSPADTRVGSSVCCRDLGFELWIFRQPS
jgi:hypothetical protein